MKLTDLDAHFVGKFHRPPESETTGYSYMPTIDGAQGVIFQCPSCAVGKEPGEEDGRRFFRGAHYVLCWFRNPRNASPVPDDADPKPGRWWAEGDSLENLTFGHGGPPIAKSVLLTSGCNWHGFVSNGDAT